jgi:hypothetical protein
MWPQMRRRESCCAAALTSLVPDTAGASWRRYCSIFAAQASCSARCVDAAGCHAGCRWWPPRIACCCGRSAAPPLQLRRPRGGGGPAHASALHTLCTHALLLSWSVRLSLVIGTLTADDHTTAAPMEPPGRRIVPTARAVPGPELRLGRALRSWYVLRFACAMRVGAPDSLSSPRSSGAAAQAGKRVRRACARAALVSLHTRADARGGACVALCRARRRPHKTPRLTLSLCLWVRARAAGAAGRDAPPRDAHAPRFRSCATNALRSSLVSTLRSTRPLPLPSRRSRRRSTRSTCARRVRCACAACMRCGRSVR